MSDRPSYDLDRLFQRGSERHDFEYNPAAWQAMEQLLAKDARRRRLFFLFAGSGTAVLVIVALLFFNPFATHPETDPIEQTQILRSDQANTQPAPAAGKSGDIASSSATNATHPGQNNAAPETERLTHVMADVRERQDENNTVTSGAIGKEASQREESPHSATHTVQSETTREKSDVKTDATAQLPIASLTSEETPEARPQFTFAFLTSSYLMTEPQRTLPDAGVIPETDHRNLIEKAPGAGHLALGLAVSGESVATRTQSLGAPGAKFGAFAEYAISNRLSISTGVAITRKDYPAGPDDYTLPADVFDGHLIPYEADAACRLLEIPLSLSYYFNGRNKPGFALHTGVVSFVMLNEQYTFDYRGVWYPGIIEDWTAPAASEDWMRIAEVSAGYRFGLTAGTMLEVAPYMQLPIGTVGAGQVRLNSFGIALRMELVKF